MSTGEGVGGGARGDHSGEDGDHRSERINVGAGDESVTRIQLAARWAEAYGPRIDSLGSVLKRFRAAYEFLDSVTHGVEPADLDRDLTDSQGVPQPVPPAPAYAAPAEPPSAQAPQAEVRPWA